MKEKIWTLISFEMSGSALLSILFLIFKVETAYYVAVPFIGFILGMTLDFIGSTFLTRLSKRFFRKRFSEIPKETVGPKKEEFLLIQNISRSMILISIVIMATFWESSDKYIFLGSGIFLFVISTLQFIRFEFLVKTQIYNSIKAK